MTVASGPEPTDDNHAIRSTTLSCEVRVEPGPVVSAMRSEPDVSTDHSLGDALSRAITRGNGGFRIDLTELSYIDVAVGRILAAATARYLVDGVPGL